MLRIIWKESIDDSIKTYKMNRVVYGTTCALYLAQRVLKELVLDDGHNYPLAASAVSSDMYMDDILTGAADIYSAKQLKEQLIECFSEEEACNCINGPPIAKNCSQIRKFLMEMFLLQFLMKQRH
ncbi:hypothetical protein AVEN_134053-1 [Araneus ventricosus]|uniref:Uncharacterized protein n=1 Tax=Araneus ventricosus TaxID=182803 RepID=A0A4Y2KV86_ARAVE|nr:hypothetical protein AVEN_134053-1 [Araneus ventricosus]